MDVDVVDVVDASEEYCFACDFSCASFASLDDDDDDDDDDDEVQDISGDSSLVRNAIVYDRYYWKC